MKYFLIGLISLIGLVALSFVFGWTDILFTKTVGKAQQNANREVFEQTQSYVEGKRQELTKYRLEYMQSKTAQDSNAIKMTILQDFANFDNTKLPPELKSFLESLQNN